MEIKTFGSTFGDGDLHTKARAVSRDRVLRAARAGRPPREAFDEETLQWAFERHEDGLQHCEEVAAEVIARRQDQQERNVRGREVKHLAEQILRQWENDKRAAAMDEARRRLGLVDEPVTPEKAAT